MKQKNQTLTTKTELKKTEKALRTELKKTEKALRTELLRLEEKMEGMEERTDENAKKYRDQVLNKLDKVMGELETMRQENTIGAYQTRELRNQVDDHEKRLVQLEKAPEPA